MALTRQKVLGNLGSAFHMQGLFDKALVYQENRLQIALQLNDSEGEGESA